MRITHTNPQMRRESQGTLRPHHVHISFMRDSRDMKKLLLGLVGLSAALASCGGSVDIGGPLTITALNSYTTDWYRNVPDGNGGLKPEYVICNDRATTVYMDVSWNGPLSQLAVQFQGSNNTTVEKRTSVFSPDYSGRDVFNYVFQPGMAPLSLTKSGVSAQSVKPQAIIVNPVNQGTTFVNIYGFDAYGIQSNTLVGPQGIPVVICG
ncbi:MAG: hypothetical protein JWQ08_1828 [Deinococcus sp.]|nr:hypothetical protein [Deinococcus sp.]